MAELAKIFIVLHFIVYLYGAWLWYKLVLKTRLFDPVSSVIATAIAIVVLDHQIACYMLVLALHLRNRENKDG